MVSTVMIVPCYNEATRLRPEAFRAFAQAWTHGRFLFVDDGSVDDTLAILSRLQAALPERFDILRLPSNAGKAEAVRQGFLQALQTNPEYVGFWDSDLATPLETILLFESVLKERPQTEVVIGARVKLLGRDVRRKPTRHYLGRAFATAVAIVTGLEVYDSQCGAKLFRATRTVRTVFATPFRSRWIFDVEILIRFLKLGQPQTSRKMAEFLYELPLPVWHDVPGSRLRAKDFARALVDLARIYRATS